MFGNSTLPYKKNPGTVGTRPSRRLRALPTGERLRTFRNRYYLENAWIDQAQTWGESSSRRALQKYMSLDRDHQDRISITDQVIADRENPLPSISAPFNEDHNELCPIMIRRSDHELFGPEWIIGLYCPMIGHFLGISSADWSQILGLDSTQWDLQNDV